MAHRASSLERAGKRACVGYCGGDKIQLRCLFGGIQFVRIGQQRKLSPKALASIEGQMSWHDNDDEADGAKWSDAIGEI